MQETNFFGRLVQMYLSDEHCAAQKVEAFRQGIRLLFFGALSIDDSVDRIIPTTCPYLQSQSP